MCKQSGRKAMGKVLVMGKATIVVLQNKVEKEWNLVCDHHE